MDAEIRGKWRNLRSLIHVETQTTQLDSGEIRREVRYHISSLDELASAFQSHIRQHWSIENRYHWVLDTAFREGHNQTYIGHAAKNLGALRRIVLNLLKIDLTDTRSLPKKRRRAMLDLTYRDYLPPSLDRRGFHGVSVILRRNFTIATVARGAKPLPEGERSG